MATLGRVVLEGIPVAITFELRSSREGAIQTSVWVKPSKKRDSP